MSIEIGRGNPTETLPGYTNYSLFPEYEFVYDDYYVKSYEWYSHDGSYCTYEVDKSALYTNVLHRIRIPVSTGVVIILLKADTIWWLNG